MEISKLKIAWKYLTGGGTAVIDYILDCANSLVAKLDGAKQDEIKYYFTTASKILDTLSGLSWLCPKKWIMAYQQTVQAFADLVDALSDLKLTSDEIAKVSDAFRLAYAAWRAE